MVNRQNAEVFRAAFLRILVFLYLLGSPTCVRMGIASDDYTLASAYAEGYLNNRESIEFLTCRFKIRVGTAKSVDQAMSGVFDTQMQCEGLWVFRNGRYKFEVQCSEHAVKQNLRTTEDGKISTLPIAPQGVLGGGQHVLTFSPTMHHATITDPGEPATLPAITPFGMGVMGPDEKINPGYVIKKWIQDKLPIEHLSATVPGAEDQVLVQLCRERGQPEMQYTFAADRGYSLISHSYTDPSTKKRSFVLEVPELIQLSKGQWMPKRSVLVMNPDRDAHKYYVKVIDVLEVESAAPPPEDTFSLNLPAFVSISNTRDPNSAIRIESPTTIYAKDLPVVAERCRVAASEPRRNLEGNGGGLITRRWLLLGNAAVIAALFLFILWRRYRMPEA